MPATGLWLQLIRRYIGLILFANLGWEILQLPLYTIWHEGQPGEIAFAVFHCTLGDVLIATASLLAALAIFASGDWPRTRFYHVLLAATLFGVTYTLYSEWVNVNVRESWAYTGLMPTIPPLNAGLAPVLQWLLLPPLCLILSARAAGIFEDQRD